jgi:HK97 family phage major capsid protein
LGQSSQATFESTPLIAEEIAVILAIPDSVLADSTFDLWSGLSPLVARAFARRLDRAVIFGQEKPATWPAGMAPAAIAAGNTVTRTADPVVDVLAAARDVAESEYDPTAAAVATGWQYRAASARSDAFTGSPVGAGQTFPLTIAGLPIVTNPPTASSDGYDPMIMARVLVTQQEHATRRAPGHCCAWIDAMRVDK